MDDILKEALQGNEADEPTLVRDGDELGVLPVKNRVLFTGVFMPITITRPKSSKLVKKAFEEGKMLAVVCQKEEAVAESGSSDLYRLGVAVKVLRIIPISSGSKIVILQGIERIYLEEIQEDKPHLTARISLRPEVLDEADKAELAAIAQSIKSTTLRIFNKLDNFPQESYMGIQGLTDPQIIVNYVAANFIMSVGDRQNLLEISDIKERAIQLLQILAKEDNNLSVKEEITKKTQEELNKNQREYYLQQQMHTIQKELGDTTEKDVNRLKERGAEKHWSEEVAAKFEAELKKLERMGTHSPEYPGQLNYLETLLSLPWGDYTTDNLDIRNAQNVLEQDHYGMEDVKERILEHLAVLQQIEKAEQMVSENPDSDARTAAAKRTPILCLYGPPGVGKTSLGKSIAKALGRKYARISLGGLHDEAEIRGHRKTYIGAMPGRIVANLQKVQSSNPVFVLDEIDKVTSDFHGDPTSALLEVLDPEQNSAFHDNYLDVDYDLSKVLFIATANSLQSIPRPLLDRMELIEMTGYLQEEKEQICAKHLIPKELEAHGLQSSDVRFTPQAIRKLIDDYTRESGVRELDRQVQSVIRKYIKQRATGCEVTNVVDSNEVRAYLGKEKYSRDRYETNEYTGVVTGLAWTQVGGEILFIETSLSPSKSPTLTLTGNLGDVMKESATIALGYIKAHAADFDIDPKKINTMSVHLHVPEGAIPKDGPSAGITMTTAMISAFTGRRVRERLAMTGEMTLRGKVLPVGGIKEKILAAKRAGITDIMLCYENEKDVLEIKPEYVQGVTFHYVHDIHEVVEFALV